MGSLNPDSEKKQEFDDSGYVQEDNKESPKQPSTDVYHGVTELLDLSDDVLLYILQHCSPMDLKALGFTCNRLAALILDRTLWQRVDARDRPCGPRRVRWFMSHAIGYNTTSIKFSGYARDTKGTSMGQTVNNDKIDMGASGDGPSVSQASTSQASSSQTAQPQATIVQAKVSETQALALAQAIIEKSGKKDQNAINMANLSHAISEAFNHQASTAHYHIIDKSSQNSATQASANPLSSCQVHIEKSSSQNSATQASANVPSGSQVNVVEKSSSQNSATQASVNVPSGCQVHITEKSSNKADNQASNSQSLTNNAHITSAFEKPSSSHEGSNQSEKDSNKESIKTDSENQASASQACKKEESDPQASSSKEIFNVQASTSKASAEPSAARAPSNNVANGVPPQRRPNPEEDRVIPPRLYRLSSQSMPSYGNQIPYWPESLLRSDHPTSPSPKLTSNGPQVTMTSRALEHLSALCPKLEELALEYCIIDCATVSLSMFPNYLKKLSFRGSKCYNMEKSFLFKIQDYLSDLEELDLSYCEWVEPACMLPLSKLQNLHTLYLRECPKLYEFVAYASLATRYGFKALKVLDLRGSPVGDSEVSALGWLPRLERLLLARPEPAAPPAHGDKPRAELDDWEEDEPEFFRNKRHNHAWLYDDYNKPKTNKETAKTGDEHVVQEGMVSEPVTPNDSNANHSTIHGPSLFSTGIRGSQLGLEEYREALSSFFRDRRTNAPSAFIISNNRTYSVVHNDIDVNRNDPNGQPFRFMNCRPGRSNDDERPAPSPRSSPGSNDDEKPGPSRVRDENGNDDGPTPAKKMKMDDCPGPSKTPSDNEDQSDSDDETPKFKRPFEKSTDNSQNQEEDDNQPSSSSQSTEPKTQRYVRFRQHQPPIIIEKVRTNNDNSNNNNDEQNNNDDDTNDNREPRHRILFVNVGRRRHAMYQLSMPVCTVSEPVDLRTNNVIPNSLYVSPVVSRLATGALVSDSAIRRFGRADGENISYVHIGPNGPIPAPYEGPNSRPNRSNLRVLSATGFRNITNLSLEHLATAAPHLRFIDFTGTCVTAAGVENFKTLRPDCKVRFSSGNDSIEM